MRTMSVLAGWAVTMAGAAWAAPAEAPRLALSGAMQPGLWQMRDAGGRPFDMCVRDPAVLLQLRNRGAQCSRFVIDDRADAATVHLTCPGRGHNRTTITVQTPRHVRIESEGLEGGAPFSLDIDARRIGACPA